MNICLKTEALQKESRGVVLKLQDRLPEHICSSCELSCELQVKDVGDYYLLTMNISGLLVVRCQRCLGEFQESFDHQSQLAVCANDARAEKLAASFECIVVANNQVDLVELLTDELHLFSPQMHPNLTDCDVEISQLIGNSSSTTWIESKK